MRKNRVETTNITEASFIDDVMVASMNANINTATGAVNVTSSIRNKELYDANKEEVQQDISEFQEEVYAMI